MDLLIDRPEESQPRRPDAAAALEHAYFDALPSRPPVTLEAEYVFLYPI